MASARDVLKLIVDADSSGAVKEFGKLGSSIRDRAGDADAMASGLKGKLGSAMEGLAGKSTLVSSSLNRMGVSGQQAGAAIAGAIPAASVVAAGAVVAFGVHAVNAFQDTALAAGKFSEATGLGVEEASKYIAVADDIGISAGTFQGAFTKMEKALGTNKQAFADLGVEIAHTKDGSVDLSATFLNAITAIQGIKDPTEKAAAASKLFGKGWTEVAELINTSATDIKKSLGEVSEAQVIDEGELEKARDYRAAMDDFQDSIWDVSIAFGEVLVPAIASSLGQLADFITFLHESGEAVGTFVGQLDAATGNTGFFDSIKQGFTDAIPGNFVGQLTNITRGYTELRDHIGGTGETVKAYNATELELTGTLGQQDARLATIAQRHRDIENAQRAATGTTSSLAGAAALEAQAHEKVVAALNAEIAARLAGVNATFAAHSAQLQYNEAVLNAAQVSTEFGESSLQAQVANDQAAQAALNMAAAAGEVAKESGAADGGQQAFIDTLKVLSANAAPAVKASLDTVIEGLQTTGEQHPEPTLGLNDQATTPMSNVQLKLIELNSAFATVTVDADTSSATAKVNALMGKIRQSSVLSAQFAMGAGGNFDLASGGPIPGAKGQPVFGVAHGGEYVLSADVVDRIKRGGPSLGAAPASGGFGGGGGNTYINVTVARGSEVTAAKEIKKLLAAGTRVGVN